MDYAKYMHPADQICTVMRRIYDQGLTTLTGGNLSVMDPEGVMWVSPSGIDKAALRREDIVRVLSDGSAQGKHRPTCEYRIHKRIYEIRPDIKALVHAHPPALVAMSVAHLVPNVSLIFGALDAAERVGLAEYAMAGTPELVDCVAEVFAQGYNAAILKNHAAFLGSARDLFDGMRRFEQLDFTARTELSAGALAEPRSAPDKDIALYREVMAAPVDDSLSVIHTPAELAMRRELTAVAGRAYKKQLFTGLVGTISGRVAESAFLISPAAKDNAYMAEGDFVHVENGCCEPGKRPDGAWKTHAAIYKKHPRIRSVITAAPELAGGYAVCDKPFDVSIIPESYGVLRDTVRLTAVEFLTRPDRVAACFDNTLPLCVVDNFGLLMAGTSPVLAFDKLEVAESTARSLFLAGIAHKTIIPMTKAQQAEADKLG